MRTALLKPWRTVLLMVGVLLLGSAIARAAQGEVVPLPRPQPPGDGLATAGDAYFNFTAPLLGGGELTLSDCLADGVVILLFWSVNCAPCLEEMPLMVHLQDTYGPRGLAVVAVNIDRVEPEKLEKMLEEKSIETPNLVVLDPTISAAKNYVSWGVPVTVMIGTSGVVSAVHTGYKPELAEVLEAEVQRLLDRLEAGASRRAAALWSAHGRP